MGRNRVRRTIRLINTPDRNKPITDSLISNIPPLSFFQGRKSYYKMVTLSNANKDVNMPIVKTKRHKDYARIKKILNEKDITCS